MLDGEAFFLIGAMIAFHKPIVLWMVWGADVHLNAQSHPKAQQSRRKIAADWRPDRARIAIQSNTLGKPIALDSRSERLKEGFGGEIRTHLTQQEDRGAFIDDIKSFCHMLLFASWRHRIIHDGAHIFEIDLPALQGSLSGQIRLGSTRRAVHNPL